MIDLQHTLGNPSLQRLGLTLVHFVWQGAVGALVAGLVLWGLRRSSAVTRYSALLVVLGTMAALPVVTFAALSGASTEVRSVTGVRAAELAPAVSSEPTSTADPSPPRPARRGWAKAPASGGGVIPPLTRVVRGRRGWMAWVSLAWMVGVFTLSARLLVKWRLVLDLRRNGFPPRSSDWTQLVASLSERLGLHRAPSLLEAAGAGVPMVIGCLRPVVLLPGSVLTGLPPDQLEAVVCHELAHLRRSDHLVNLAQTVIEVLLFYHPAVWWISRRIRVEREHCCDDLTVAICGDAGPYLRALAALETSRSTSGAVVLAACDRSLVERVRRLTGSRDSSCTRSAVLAVPLAISVLLAVGAVLGLSMLSPNAAQHIERLSSADPAERAAAASALGSLGVDARPAGAALAKALEDEDERVRRAAMRAVGDVGLGVDGAVPGLLRSLVDAGEEEKRTASEALAGIRRARIRAVQATDVGGAAGVGSAFEHLDATWEELHRRLRDAVEVSADSADFAISHEALARAGNGFAEAAVSAYEQWAVASDSNPPEGEIAAHCGQALAELAKSAEILDAGLRLDEDGLQFMVHVRKCSDIMLAWFQSPKWTGIEEAAVIEDALPGISPVSWEKAFGYVVSRQALVAAGIATDAAERDRWLQHSIEVLKGRITARPDSWHPYLEVGWWLYDFTHQKRRAAEYLRQAAEFPDAPSIVTRLVYRSYEGVLDFHGLFAALQWAVEQHQDDDLHQSLAKRDLEFWEQNWQNPDVHRREIVKENAQRAKRGVPFHLYPHNSYWEVCPDCGMPSAKGATRCTACGAALR